MSGISKKIAAAGIFLGLVFIFLFCGLLYLETGSVQTRIQRTISSRMTGEISWKKVTLSPFPGRVALEAFQITGPDKNPLAGFKRLAVDIAWLRLLKGEISLSSIELDSPKVILETDTDGTLTLVKALQGPAQHTEKPDRSPGPFPLNITIDTLVITDGEGLYHLPGKKISVSGLNLQITNADFLAKKAIVAADIGSASISSPDLSVGLDAFTTRMEFHDNSLSPFSLDLTAPGIRLGLRGSIKDLFDTPFMDMTLDAQVVMQEISGLFSPPPAVSGTAKIHVTALGSMDNPKLTLRADCGKSVLQGRPIDRIALELALKNRLVRLLPSRIDTPAGQLSLTGEADLVPVFPKGFLSPQRDLHALAYTLFLEQDGTAVSTLLPDVPAIGGSVSSRIRLKGKGIDPERLTAALDLDLAVRQFKTAALDLPVDMDLKAAAGFEDNTALLKSLTAVSKGIRLSGEGRFSPASGNVAGTLALSMDDLGSAPGLSTVKGTGDLTLSAGIAGSYLAPEITLDLVANRLGVKDIYLGTLLVKASLDSHGRVVLDRLTLDNQGSNLIAAGWADLFTDHLTLHPTLPMAMDLSFKDVEISHFSSLPGLKGVFSGTSRITGSLADPEAVAEVSGKDLALASYTLGDGSLDLHFSQKTLFIDAFRLTNKGSHLAAQGNATLLEEDFSLMADPEFQVSLQGSSLFLSDFSDRMDGRLSVNGMIKGSSDDLSGNLDLTGSQLSLEGQEIDGFSLETVLEGHTVTIKDMDIRVTPDAGFKGQGWVSFPDRRWEIRLSSQDFPLTALDILTQKALTGGQMSMDLSGSGTFDHPVVKSRVTVVGMEINHHPLDDMDLSIGIENRVARVKGRMGMQLEGEYHFDDNTFLAAADMDAFDLSSYFNAAGQDDFSGRITGSIASSGKINDLQMIQAKADINTLSLEYKKEDFIHIPDLTLSMANGRFHLPEARVALLGKEGLKIKGEGSLKENIHLELNGKIPFPAITPLLGEINDASGDILLSAALEGSVSDPRLSADVRLAALGMSVPGIEQKFKGINGTIKITPEFVEIQRVTGGLDDGRFDLSGTIGLKGLFPETYHLDLTGQQLFLEFPDMMDITLNTRLSLTGNRDKSDLKGDIVLLEGRYSKAVELNLARAAEKKREFKPDLEKQETPFLEKMALDIDIRHGEPFWVDNNLALLSIRSDLKLSGTAADPLIAGRARVESGTITFQKNEFEVKKGVIDFINPYRIEPSIDVEADLSVRSWIINLIVTGTPDNLDFKFTSTPKEEHADILSLLAFGKTTRELRKADGGSVVSPDDILAGFVAETLQKNIKDASGIDYLEIKPDSGDNHDTPGVNVVVGKELSRQMTVKYGVDVRNGETVQRMTTDYKLLENLLMRGFQDTGGHFGGELKYRLEFR